MKTTTAAMTVTEICFVTEGALLDLVMMWKVIDPLAKKSRRGVRCGRARSGQPWLSRRTNSGGKEACVRVLCVCAGGDDGWQQGPVGGRVLSSRRRRRR